MLYLARPESSTIIEAHRHLVEAVEGMRPELVAPRAVLVAEVVVTNVADLRDADARSALDLTDDVVFSAARDPAAYEKCRTVARAAHQLEIHGILAPAAGGFSGETLALFPAHLPVGEQPRLVDIRTWTQLPADPRRLRALRPVDKEHG